MAFSFEEFPNSDFYNSDLREILTYVRKLEAYVKTWDETIKQLQEYTKEIPDLQKRVTALEPLVTKLRSDVSYILTELKEIDDWKELTNAKLLILGNRIDRLKTYVDEMDKVLMADYNHKFYLFNLKLNQMKQQLMGYISGIIDRMEYIIEHLSSDVLDPIEDKRLTFDKNNMNIYNRLNCFCITEEEFAELGLTEDEFKAIGFTQMQYALESAKVLGVDFVFAPISGIRKTHEQAIAEVVTFISGTMTEDEFATLNLTEDEFAELNLTHEQYLKYNSSRGAVFVDPSNTGLTENQYQHLGV